MTTFADQVGIALSGHNGLKNPTGKHIAAELGVSEATLHRRLALKKTSLRTLVDDKLYAIAAHYLKESRLTITEIAQITGFAESASFTRALQRWSGQPPAISGVINLFKVPRHNNAFAEALLQKRQ